jgi:hypothetical protein
MKRLAPLILTAALSACGLDVATSAATSASLKKLEQAKKTQDQFQQKLGQALEQTQQAAQNREDAQKQ